MPTASHERVQQLHTQMTELRKELYGAFKEMAQMDVPDVQLQRADGSPVMLSELFEGKDELLLIHNMGRSCAYCTLWADGFNGVCQHIANRVPFALLTPDDPATATAFARSRGWTMPIACYAESKLAETLGFKSPQGYMPGMSTLKKSADASITRTGMSFFGPGDDFCAIWHMFELLPNGVNNWEPKFSYSESCGPSCACH